MGADTTLADLLRRAEDSDEEDMRRLAVRIRNLGVPIWDVWATVADTPAREVVPADHRVIVADLGGLELVEERSVLTAGLLDWLWRLRHERTPRLVVIGGAHNVCPQVHDTELQALETDHVNSTIDIDHRTRVFGFVPPSLLHKATAFRLGEGLVAGRISSRAALRGRAATDA